jgi:hypothetical protein
MQVAERGLVERGRLHHPPSRELVDHHLDEADLRGRETPIVQELGEHGLRGRAVQAHEAEDEVDQRRRLAATTLAAYLRTEGLVSRARTGSIEVVASPSASRSAKVT